MSGERERNLLIEASAGTGKTYMLVERMLDQLRAGVRPQEIVALTFSRAAAGEIFARFVGMLADRAAADPKDAQRLRQVVETQHLSMIGTLDSFLMRIIRSFPLELGLGAETTILGEYEAKAAAAAVAFGVMRRSDRAALKAFNAAFRQAMNHLDSRQYIEAYRKLIARYHQRLLAYPAASVWGEAAAIWPAGMAFPPADEAELAAAAAALADTGRDNADIAGDRRLSAAWAKLVAWVAAFRGRFSNAASLFGKIVGGGDVFTRPLVEFRYYRQYAFGGEVARAIRRAVSAVFGYALRQKLEMTKGIRDLLVPFEREYARKVRSAGRLTFADLPRLIMGLDEFDRLAVEFRLDARIRAWALDEFQDTSCEQWQALGNLVHEALASDGEKEVLVVGDRKQAIYGWRNGDVRIFAAEKQGGQYAVRPLDASYRYGSEICEAVNRVFRSARIRAESPGWECAVHSTAVPERHGYVKVMDAPGRQIDDFVTPIAAELAATRPWERGVDAAILVRTNTLGRQLADALKAAGITQVAWEGESAILDTPALRAFTDLVRLAEHPGDAYAWAHFRWSPLLRAWYGGDVPEAATVAAEFARHFTRKGLVRTFMALRAKLPATADLWSDFTESRFADMLRAAAEFELGLEPGSRLSDFEAYLEAQTKRDFAQSGTVKIMTIHRSKGLTFDYVLLPLYEPDGLGTGGDDLLADPAGKWVLSDPGRLVTDCDAVLSAAAAARREMNVEEDLCAYYVAMTRARFAVSMFLMPPVGGETAVVRFSDLVRESGLGAGVGEADFGLIRPGAAESGPARSSARPCPPPRERRERIRRQIPSRDFHAGLNAGELFRTASARTAAMAAGTAKHAELEAVEFLSSAANDFERSLLRPADFTELWRESPFELLVDGRWTSGQFDRVVFTGTGAERRAVIYDFKTNAKRPGESDEDLARRLKAAYAGQMAVYRGALSVLTGIAKERIETVLLLPMTGAAVPVDLV